LINYYYYYYYYYDRSAFDLTNTVTNIVAQNDSLWQ